MKTIGTFEKLKNLIDPYQEAARVSAVEAHGTNDIEIIQPVNFTISRRSPSLKFNQVRSATTVLS